MLTGHAAPIVGQRRGLRQLTWKHHRLDASKHREMVGTVEHYNIKTLVVNENKNHY